MTVEIEWGRKEGGRRKRGGGLNHDDFVREGGRGTRFPAWRYSNEKEAGKGSWEHEKRGRSREKRGSGDSWSEERVKHSVYIASHTRLPKLS